METTPSIKVAPVVLPTSAPPQPSSPTSARYGVFAVGSHLVGIPVDRVREMFVLRDVRHPPGMPSHQRGVATLRGTALPAVDLRVCLGLPAASAELSGLIELLQAREQDHRAWLDELEGSIRERRRFDLATDPHTCKFGTWFYAFRTDDVVLRGELARIEAPHTAIHALAAEVLALQARGDHAAALAVVDRARAGLLGELVRLFGAVRKAVVSQHREIGVVVSLAGRTTVLIVDVAEAVADLDLLAEEDDPLASGQLLLDLVQRIARWKGTQKPVLLLDVERITALS